jgi:hypothetical protein
MDIIMPSVKRALVKNPRRIYRERENTIVGIVMKIKVKEIPYFLSTVRNIPVFTTYLFSPPPEL